MSAHRYWRIHVTQNYNPGWGAVLLSEVQFRATAGGAPLTGTWTGSPTSTGAGAQVVDLLHDGDFSTYYQTGENPQPADCFIQIDLGAGNESDVLELALAPRPANEQYCPQTFALLFSDDNATFFLKDSFSNIPMANWVDNTFQTFATPDAPLTSNALAFAIPMAATAPPSGVEQLAFIILCNETPPISGGAGLYNLAIVSVEREPVIPIHLHGWLIRSIQGFPYYIED